MFSTKFVSATRDYSTFEKMVPAPYLRKSFEIGALPAASSVTICGLGFYELYVNGTRITKGLLAPYISNPDDILYYDRYDVKPLLKTGRNVIAVLLGNGMLNCPGGDIWDFQLARFRSAPKVALCYEAESADGEKTMFEADESFRCAPSPIYYDDLRAGEYYDARREIPGWNLPDFDDSGWTSALPAETPRGECRLCQAEPIVTTHELAPVSIRRAAIGKLPDTRKTLPVLPYADETEAAMRGWLYDFGVNAAGLCRLKVRGHAGQKIVLQFGEALDENGDLDLRGMTFLPHCRNHRDIYICKGDGEEIYVPSFTYHGFRYCLVLGLEDVQATSELLTYQVMNSDLKVIGGFSCSDDVLNKLYQATLVSDLANFYYFPTDCPHREKNGWTGDAALSAEQMLMNLTAENSYREWLNNIRAAQLEDGRIPGIVPTTGWGFEWGNGPAWDCVLANLPFFIWRYRGDTAIIRENAAALMRYLTYIMTRRDERGLIHIGLGDWVHTAHSNHPKAPLVLTDTIECMDISRKSAMMFAAANLEPERMYAQAVYDALRAAARKYLIDPDTMTAYGCCQASQAMAIFYDLFDPAEKSAAMQVLLEMIEDNDELMDVGMLAGRVLFRLLAQSGHADLAYRMIVTPRNPSYGNWIKKGATSLWEDLDDDEAPASLNHHMWGDISAFMIECIAGIQVNPCCVDPAEIRIHPHFIADLSHAEGRHRGVHGEIVSAWKREGALIRLTLTLPEGYRGDILLDKDWQFDDGRRVKDLKSGEYVLLPRTMKDKYFKPERTAK